MAKGGRIFKNKDGSEKAAHHIDPHVATKVPDSAVTAAHGYRKRANEKFVERSADENAALAKAAADAGKKPAPNNIPNQEAK